MILYRVDRGRLSCCAICVGPRLVTWAQEGPEINSTPLASPGTVASLFSLQGADEIRVRLPGQFPC
jgi:hypothetical protein